MPSMFAAIAAQTVSSVFFPCTDGNANRINGERSFDSFFMAPASRRTSSIPHQRHIIPVSDMTRSTAPAAPFSTAEESDAILPPVTAKANESKIITKMYLPIMKNPLR